MAAGLLTTATDFGCTARGSERRNTCGGVRYGRLTPKSFGGGYEWAEAAGEMSRRLLNIIAVGIVDAAIAFGMAALEVIL